MAQEDLENEVEAINSIYSGGTLEVTDVAGVYVLHIPNQDVALRIQFSEEYPETPPIVLGTQSSGEGMRKGEAAHILGVFREAVGRVFQPGDVCLYDVIEDVLSSLNASGYQPGNSEDDREHLHESAVLANRPLSDVNAPPWTISEAVIELKSVFVARCAPVASPEQAKQYLRYLLQTDKKVAKATHNITAHRIKGENGVTFQDCDDDGETAAGSRVLHLMQLMDLWNVMVVVTRWYGGQKLGPARFGIINTVARDAFVKGGYVLEHDTSRKKAKR